MGDAEGQVHSLLADALTQATQTQPRKEVHLLDSQLSRGGEPPVTGLFFSGLLSHTLCATRRSTLNILHQPEPGWCSKSQLIGGWSVTLATQAEEFLYWKLWKNLEKWNDNGWPHWPRLWLQVKWTEVIQDAFPRTRLIPSFEKIWSNKHLWEGTEERRYHQRCFLVM